MSSTSTHFQPSYAPSITLFGSTGGCLLSTLKHLLLNPPTTSPPQQITLLVRSKEKLHNLLTSEPHNLPSALLTQGRLRILEGDLLTSPASVVLSAITNPAPEGTQAGTGNISDVILFGIGGYPKGSFIPPFFELDNPDICRSAMERVLDAVRSFGEIQAQSQPQPGSLQTTKKPLILAISSTGLYDSSEPRDLPIPLLPLYKLLLRGPHQDKLAMEELLFSAASSSPSSQTIPTALCDAVIIRGALFNSNPLSDTSLNPHPIKAGYADRKSRGSAGAPGKEREEGYGNEGNRYGDLSGPAIGYGISRADLGWWIWEEIASGKRGWSSEGVYKGEWLGKKVSLTN